MNTESSSETRDNVISFLRYCGNSLKSGQDSAAIIAYSIAGLMATDYVKSLPSDDPLNEILVIAGELEIDPENKEALKNELIRAIDQLKY